MPRLVLFDLDGTLIPLPSCERRFAIWLLHRRHIGIRQLARSLSFALRWAPRYGRQVWKKNKAYVAGLPALRVQTWAEEFVRETLLPLLRPQLLQALRAHQALGDPVALLTGAADFLAYPLSRALGIEHCIASVSAQRNGRYCALPPRRHPFGAEKLRLARELCALRGCTLEQVIAYADSIHDTELLAAVGHPVAVCPDRSLRQQADSRDWTILT